MDMEWVCFGHGHFVPEILQKKWAPMLLTELRINRSKLRAGGDTCGTFDIHCCSTSGWSVSLKWDFDIRAGCTSTLVCFRLKKLPDHKFLSGF